MLGLSEPAAEPLGHGQKPHGGGVQHPLAFAELGQGLRRERGRGLGVTPELGEITPVKRDVRRNVHRQAASLADRRLERLIGRARASALGCFEQRLHGL